MTRFYRCRKCGTKVLYSYLGQHWLRKHFELMYILVEYETQAVFELTGEIGQAKTKDEIDKEYGYCV